MPPNPISKINFFSCQRVAIAGTTYISENCWSLYPPPPRNVALQNYGALQLLELHEVPTSTRCLLPVRLLDLYVSSVVWICTYDPSCLFQKNKTVTVMWCDYTLAAVHLILYAFESWPCDFVSLVLLHSPWSGSAALVDVFIFFCYGDTKTESDTDCWYPRLPLWATGVFQEKR